MIRSLLIVLLGTFLIFNLASAGNWTANEFIYKPATGARGQTEKNSYDSGLDRVDARLSKERWVGDPKLGDSPQSAISAIGSSTPCILRVAPGTYSVAEDLTVPANVTLAPERGALLAVADGKTLTLNGGIQAGPWQIFSWAGTGAIQINSPDRTLLAEWFGASTSASDNGPAVQKAVASFGADGGPGGGTLVFGHGTYTFTSPAVSSTNFSPDITFKGQGSGNPSMQGTDAHGTRLEYTGTGTLFSLNVSQGNILKGWHWQDLAIYCTSTGNAIEINDTIKDASQVGGVNNWSLKNVALFGTGGDFGFGAVCAFDGSTDNNFCVQGFKWGVYLVDCDGCEINGRAVVNNQHTRIITRAAPYGNENRVRMRLMTLADYGDERYLVYDTAHMTKYEHQQYEGGVDDYAFYLNGVGTIFDHPFFSGHAGRIGPDAQSIRFISPKGGVSDQIIIDTPTNYYIGVEGNASDYCIYFHDPSVQYRPAIPVNPRVVVLANPNSNEYDPATSGANRAETQAHSLSAMMGRPGVHSTQFLINALLKGYCAGLGGISWLADANALSGWTLKVPSWNTTGSGLLKRLTEGKQINASDTLAITIRYRASAAPDLPTNCSVYAIGSIGGYYPSVALPSPTTSYQTATVVYQLAASAGETLDIGVLHTLVSGATNLDLYVDYLSIVPYAQSIRSHAFVMYKQSVAYAATVTPDWSKGAFLVVGQLTGNVQLANPSVAAIEGQKVCVKLNADGSNRTVTYGNAYKATYAQVTANKTAVVEFLYDGTNYIQVGAVQQN